MSKVKVKETSSLSDTAYQTLRKAILSGELAAGFFASDREICEQFSFSRTPVREAVLRLRDEKLVEVLPRKGMRVCPLMAEDMQEMSTILKALAQQASIDIATKALDASAVDVIAVAVDTLEATVNEEDRTNWLDAEYVFHMGMIELCGNNRLISVYSNLYGLMQRARYFTLYLRSPPTAATQEYRAIFEALRTGEREQLGVRFRDHWERNSTELLQLVSKYTKGTVRSLMQV